WSEVSGSADAFEVGAGLAASAAAAQDIADGEGAADECVEVDAAGEDVAAGGGEGEWGAGVGEFLECLGGDEGEVVAGAAVGAGAEGARAVGVAVAVESAAFDGVGDVEQLHVGFGGWG